MPYDPNDLRSIYEYAKKLEGHALKDVVDECSKENAARVNRKGSFGQIIEKGYFLIENNSDTRPDFTEVCAELKTTPMKMLKRGE